MPRRLASLLLVGALAAGAVAAAESGSTDGDQVIATGMALATGGVNDRTELVVALPGGGAAFLASESDEQVDLNGDGDTDDQVLQVFDGATGQTRNIGHVIRELPDTVAPVGDRRVAFVSRTGVLHVHDLDDESTSVVSQGVVSGLTRLDAGELVFASRVGSGSSLLGRSLRVFDPTDGSVVDTGLRGDDPRATAHGFVVPEPIDDDGDGSVDDVRIATWDLVTGVATVTDTMSLYPLEPLVGGTQAAFIDFEFDTDRNGDGDTDDALAAVIDLTTGAVTTTDAGIRSEDFPDLTEPGPFTALPDGRVAFVATGDEHVILDPATGTVHRTGLPAAHGTSGWGEPALPAHLVVGDSHVAFVSGGTAHVLDLVDDSAHDTGVEALWGPGFVATTSDGRLALMGTENVHVHDPVQGTTTPVASPLRTEGSNGYVAAVGDDVIYTNIGVRQGTVAQVVRVTPSGAAIAVDVPFGLEVFALDGRLGVASAEGGTDLNGDGDTDDHVLQVVTLDPNPDLTAPDVTDVATFPEPVEDAEPMTLAATITDTAGTIAGAEVVIDGIDSVRSALVEWPIEADDGAFDEPSEELRIHLTHSPGPGGHELCIWAWDDVGNTSTDTCTTFEVLPGVGPVVTDVTATPAKVLPGENLHVAATIDDTDTGGSFVAGGSVLLDGVEVAQLEPEPGGEFDMPVEYGEATVGPLQDIGLHEVCVTGVDRNGNWSDTPGCVTVEVLDDAMPILTDLIANPARIYPGAPLAIDLVATDEGQGGSVITGVTAILDGDQVVGATPTDGAWDEPTEEVQVRLAAAQTRELASGHHQVCLQAWDAAGNGSAVRCVGFDVEHDQVIGDGLFDTALQGASFSLLVERREADSPVTGTIEYVEGPFQFASDSVESFEVEASHSAVVTGTGRLNAQLDCSFVVEVTEGGPESPEPGSFSIELFCGPQGLVRHSAAGPLTDGSIDVRGG